MKSTGILAIGPLVLTTYEQLTSDPPCLKIEEVLIVQDFMFPLNVVALLLKHEKKSSETLISLLLTW